MKQPEALRLAEWLETFEHITKDEIAAELRRLHQSEREGWRYAEELEQERKRLHEANQAMLEALKEITLEHGMTDKARAAIAKGEQS